MTATDERGIAPPNAQGPDRGVEAAVGEFGRSTSSVQDLSGSSEGDALIGVLEGHTPGHMMERTLLRYLDRIDPGASGEQLPAPSEVASQLLRLTNSSFDVANNLSGALSKDKVAHLKALPAMYIARLLIRFHHVVRVVPVGYQTPTPMLAMYVPDGPDKGTYTENDDLMWQVATSYEPGLSQREWNEVLLQVSKTAPERTQCNDRDLVPVNNGIFNYATKELTPFTPDVVFLAKSRIDFDPDAIPWAFFNPDDTLWDVESWVDELSDDPEVVALMWEVLGAVVRPYVRWNKFVLPFNEKGNNGKGTFNVLLRGLVGKASCASITLEAFSKDFMLDPLIRSTAIIVDENPIGGYVRDASTIKAVVTQDVFQLNRKNIAPISVQFYGLMVQGVNEMPRFRDRSGSMARRMLPVPFTKDFTELGERTYIRDDYLHRPEVLRYVLKRVLLEMDPFYEFSEPAASRALLGEMLENNDPIRQFWTEMESRLKWERRPFNFLYDLYVGWLKHKNSAGTPVSDKVFAKDLRVIAEASGRWKATRFRVGAHLHTPEPLIIEYDLWRWSRGRSLAAAYSRMLHNAHPTLPPDTLLYGLTLVSGAAIPALDDEVDDED